MAANAPTLAETAPGPAPRKVEGKHSASTLQNVAVEHAAPMYLSKEQEASEPAAPGAAEQAGADDFPDGGWRAWLVVFGAVCTTTSTFGYVNSWGSFQSYYETTVLPTTSPSTIAWIGSVQYSLTFMPCLFTGRLFDLGYFRVPLFVASVIIVVATFVVAECTCYWHFLLCQGFAIGLASGVIFGPTMNVIGHWFHRRRGTAMGIVAMGSSIGGTVFPIMFRNLTVRVGFPWTMRIVAFLLIFFLSISNLTMRRRLPPVNVAGGLFNLRVFRNPAMTLYTLSGFVCFLGVYTVLTYIDVGAVSQGLPADFSAYLVAIANAASAFGRLGSGVLADRVGALTVMIPMTALAGVLTFAWPFAQGKGALIAVAVIYGMGSGAFVALLVPPVMALGAVEDVGRRAGLFMTLLALGALAGPPISGAINARTGGFVAVGAYAGAMVEVGVALMLVTRYVALGGWRGKF